MNRKTTTKPTGAEMRAARDQRFQADPKREAEQHESAFLKAAGTAQEELRWLVENEAWRTLGFESPVDWWETRIRPAFLDLEIRPAPVVARQVLAMVEAHERGLPAAQRRTKKELARLALASDWVAQGRREDRSKVRPAPGADLDRADIVDAEIVEAHKQAGAHFPAAPVEGTPAGGEEATPPAGVTPQDPPVADPSTFTGSARTGRDEAGAPQQPGSNSLTGRPSSSDMSEVPPATSGQSGTDHPDTGDEEPTASGSDAQPPAAGPAGDETAGASQPPQDEASAVDPQELIHELWQVSSVFDDIDVDVVGPLLTEEQITDVEEIAARLALFFQLLTAWKDKA